MSWTKLRGLVDSFNATSDFKIKKTTDVHEFEHRLIPFQKHLKKHYVVSKHKRMNHVYLEFDD